MPSQPPPDDPDHTATARSDGRGQFPLAWRHVSRWRSNGGLSSTWLRLRFEHKLTGALVATLLFAILMGVFANWTARRSQELFERSRLANAVLDGYRQLSSLKHELLQSLGHSVVIEPSRQDVEALKIKEVLLIKQLEDVSRDVRKAVLAEISFVANDPGENEKDELERIDALIPLLKALLNDYKEFSALRDQGRIAAARSRLKSLLSNSSNLRIHDLIRDGIEDEFAETEQANARAHALIRNSENLTIVSIAIAIVFGTLTAVLLIGSVRRPLSALREGMIAFANDNLAHRIPVVGRDEFAELARRFNEMAADREVRRTSLLHANERLERAVAERTQALVEANANLETMDAMRRRFLADVSHELRTPLTIIRGESDVALRGSDKSIEEYKNALARVQEQSRLTAALVDDLLFLARREAGEARLQLQPVVIADLAQRTCSDLNTTAAQSRLSIEVHNEARGIVVSADPTRLRQMLVICLDNAIRYSLPDGSIKVSISWTAGSVHIEIADQGIGISPEDLPKVFERFYRGAQANHRYAEGTGLGLPMAKSIAEAHGGTITIESEPNRGTTVRIDLPAFNRLRVVA